MSDEKYRVAIVGGAGMWGRHYLEAYAEHPDCEIVGLVDRARERRDQFAAYYGVETVYDSLEDLLKREVPDVVSTILPVEHTPGAVIACAEAGVKVVSCEKPIAVSLQEADEMVRVCRQRGVALGCGTAHWEIGHLIETSEWLRGGNIGRLTRASIPGGLPREVAGAGCVQLTMMRLVTGMEVEWVEGWTLPPEESWSVPEGASEADVDCPAYGRLGLSGGIVCEIPQPRPEDEVRCRAWVDGMEGQAWMVNPQPVLVRGEGVASTPVFPEFLRPQSGRVPWESFFTRVIERLLRAFDTGEEAQCSGHDYRQALEIAVALKLSAQRGHERVHLPLEDRSLRVFPHPYRLRGGDVAGWGSIGYAGPPPVEGRVRRQSRD